MNSKVGVECAFEADGSVRISRVNIDGVWIAVGQGRQWVDKIGRHVLIQLPDGGVKELCLRTDNMVWQISSIEGIDTRLV